MLPQASADTQQMKSVAMQTKKKLLKMVARVLPEWGGGVHSVESVELYLQGGEAPWSNFASPVSAKQLYDGRLLHDAQHNLLRCDGCELQQMPCFWSRFRAHTAAFMRCGACTRGSACCNGAQVHGGDRLAED